MPAVVSGVVLAACATTVVQSTREGLVEFAGAQKEIFTKGKAKQTLIVATMAASADRRPVLQGRPRVTRVRGDSFTLDHGMDHGAVFAVWTQQSTWRDQPIPGEDGKATGHVDDITLASGIILRVPQV